MYLHIYMDMLEQWGVTNPSYKYFTHKNTKITCNIKCSYLGTFGLSEAFKCTPKHFIHVRATEIPNKSVSQSASPVDVLHSCTNSANSTTTQLDLASWSHFCHSHKAVRLKLIHQSPLHRNFLENYLLKCKLSISELDAFTRNVATNFLLTMKEVFKAINLERKNKKTGRCKKAFFLFSSQV